MKKNWQSKILGLKEFFEFLGPKQFWVRKFFWVQYKLFGRTIFGQKKLCCKKFGSKKLFGVQKIWGLKKMLGPKRFGPEKIFGSLGL